MHRGATSRIPRGTRSSPRGARVRNRQRATGGGGEYANASARMAAHAGVPFHVRTGFFGRQGTGGVLELSVRQHVRVVCGVFVFPAVYRVLCCGAFELGDCLPAQKLLFNSGPEAALARNHSFQTWPRRKHHEAHVQVCYPPMVPTGLGFMPKT